MGKELYIDGTTIQLNPTAMIYVLLPYLLQLRHYRESETNWIRIIIIGIIIILAIRLIIAASKQIRSATHWHHHFDNVGYSSQAFYTAVERSVSTKALPGVEMSRSSYYEGGIFTAKREYLQITRKRQVFTICAAPYGNGFFVSWWHYERANPGHTFLATIPYIGPAIIRSQQSRTFFQFDTELMYKEAVKASVVEVTHAMTEEKGIRRLTDSDFMREITDMSIDGAL